MTFDVLLTGAESRQGIVTIRSLAKRGIRMMVTGESPKSIGFYSKHVEHFAQSPSPMTEPEAFVAFHAELARKHSIPFIFPVTESSLVPLNEHRSEFESVTKLIAPSEFTVSTALDKKLTLAIAEREGVPISRTLYPTSVEEAVDFAERCGYPVILKPRGRANDSRIGASFNFKVLYAKTQQELRAHLATCRDGVFPMMQDFAFGVHTQFNCFFEHGEAHSYFQDEAIRLLPMTGGVGALMRSCPVVPELAEQSLRIYRAMNWEGCGQAQFKGPSRDGQYRFIEVSVRLPASTGSAVFSGIDTPWMQFCYFTGRPVDRASSYRVGQRTRWLRGDTITIVRYLIGDTPEAIDVLPSKGAALLDYLADFFRPSVRNYVESFSDPFPGVYELRQTIVDVWKVLIRNLPAGLVRAIRRVTAPFSKKKPDFA
jgi:predicted ATP-grasp superfamily ATP-dependent carboligase